MEAKHTKGPYYYMEGMIVSESDSTGSTLAHCKDEAFGELVCLACNSHDKLTSELQASTNRLNTVIDSGLCCDDMKRSLQKQVRFNDAALALAEKG